MSVPDGSRREYQPVAPAGFADEPRRDPGGRQVPSQTDDVGPKLFGGKLGSAPGQADQLRGRKELPGPLGEEGEQLRLPTRQRQPLAGIAEDAPPNIQVEARELP